MKISGEQIINAVAARMEEEGVRCYDTAIVAKINKLTPLQVNQLASFGDVTEWHNERINKAAMRKETL